MQELEGFDDFALETMEKWQVPGLAVGVIKDQLIVLNRGYGYSDLAAIKPADSKTLFQIASITKSFTATAAAMLVDRGILDWDVPVREYLPEFKLSDPQISEKISMRDLLTHQSGLPRHDMLWMLTGYDREEVFSRLKHLEFTADLRQKWQYNNLMYMVAGYLTGKLVNSRWEDFIREQIFLPLGMHATHFLREQKNLEDMAKPYYLHEGKRKLVKLEWDVKNSCAPAGHIVSNIDDMLHYLQFHLNLGRHGTQQLVSRDLCETLHSQQAVIEEPEAFAEIGPVSTCMGFQTSTYRGHRYVHHDGSSLGYATRMSFVPSKKFGFIVLSNMLSFENKNPVPWLVARNLEDRLLGLDQIDWHSRLKTNFQRIHLRQRQAVKPEEETVAKDTQPSHILDDYVGIYEHPAYGLIRIKKSSKTSKAVFNGEFNGFKSTLHHHHYDSFATPGDRPYVVDPLGSRILTFHSNDKGLIDRLTTPMEAGLADAVFYRVVDEPTRAKKPKTELSNPTLDTWQN